MLHFLIWSYVIANTLKTSQGNSILSGQQVWTVAYRVPPEKDVINRLMQLESDGKIDVFTRNDKETTFSIHQMHKREVESFLKSADLPYTVDVQDLQKFLEKNKKEEFERKLKSKRNSAKRSTSLCSPFTDEYMSFDEIESYLSCISKQYPSRVTKMSIGKTEENRDIWMMTVGLKKHNANRTVFLIGGTHAREWISPAVTLHILHKLITSDQKTTINFEVKIVPVLNPDGYVYTFTKNRLWRKNRSRFDTGDCVGVDLNRNWGFEWGGTGSSSNCRSDIYRGSSAFSERETKAISFHMKSTPNLEMVIDIHSFSQMVLYPWGFSKTEATSASDRKDLIRMGNTFAKAAYGVNNTRYQVANAASGLYVASGISIDYSYGALGVKYSYVIELRDKGKFGFILPVEQISSTQKEVYLGIKAMLNKLKKA